MSERRSKMKPPRRTSQDSESSSSFECTSSESSEEEEIDARDLKPIKEYLNDRRELASQLFKSVKIEKIRMMLPQALKSMNLYDLEEYCGNELSGMSRKRILSIINGQRMAESSDTDETDDSGPSLEIISDTEEWLTDDDVVIKEENPSDKSKRKKPMDKVKGKSRPQSKDKTKAASKSITTNQAKNKKPANASVKIEGEKPEAKEGESLLDLLELEMRARAIRALIRKEEDIIPNKNTGTTSGTKNNSSTTNANASTSKYVVQEMQQISVTLKQGSGLDDDVMLVIQPAPTIELLSSEDENEKEKEKNDMDEEKGQTVKKKSENEQETTKENQIKEKSNVDDNEKGEHSKRINKRLENERGTDTTHSTSTIGDEPIEIPDDDLKIEDSKNSEKTPTQTNLVKKLSNSRENNEQTNQSDSTTSSENAEKTDIDKSPKSTVEKKSLPIVNESTKKLQEIKIEEIEPKKRIDNTENTNSELKTTTTTTENEKSPAKELEEGELASESDSTEETEVFTKKNSNKQFRRRRRTKIGESSPKNSNLDQTEITESKDDTELPKKIKDTENNSQNSPKEDQNPPESLEKVEKNSEDFDKTDMDEIIDLDDYPDDMDELDNNQSIKNSSENLKNTKAPSEEKSEPTETWASRYYNTDDVQNVIKESKIQSEIRKRLRERQRLSKLNNSPNASKLENNSPIENKIDEAQQKPLGLVEEYLALKAATATAESTTNQKSSLDEKNRKSHRKRDKTRVHNSKQKFKSDNKNLSKNDENTGKKISTLSRPD